MKDPICTCGHPLSAHESIPFTPDSPCSLMDCPCDKFEPVEGLPDL